MAAPKAGSSHYGTIRDLGEAYSHSFDCTAVNYLVLFRVGRQPTKVNEPFFLFVCFSTFFLFVSFVCRLLFFNNIVLYILYYTRGNELSMRALIVWNFNINNNL